MSLTFIKENKIFFGLLLLIFSGYMIMVWQPIDKLLVQLMADDAFYYFKTASNIAGGLGSTFDGEHITNGYHPLWMGISALIYYLIPDDKILPVHIILGLSVLLYFAATLLIWKIISRWILNKWAQAFLVLAYALNPWNVSDYLNGLETPLALFLLVLLFYLFLNILREDTARLSDFSLLGAVAGLLILSRLDYGLFVAAIYIYFLWKDGGFLRKPLWAFAVPAALISAPWFLYNYFYFGSPIPASGLSYTLINHRLWFYKERSLIEILLWSVYNFFGTIAFIFRTIGIPVFYSGWNLVKSFFSLLAVFGPVILAASYFYIYKKEQFKNFLRDLFHSAWGRAFMVFFAAFIGLVVVHGAIRWSGREWYFASFQFLAIIFLSILLKQEMRAVYQKIILSVLALALVLSYFSLWKNLFNQNINQLEMYQVAVWIKNNLPADARIAAFNSGIHGYFSEHFVMNSDGMINNSAYEAMRRNNLWKLFEEERIDYIVDYEITLSYRYKSFLGIDNPFERLKKIDLPADINRSGNYGGSHIGIYKLKR